MILQNNQIAYGIFYMYDIGEYIYKFKNTSMLKRIPKSFL